jgi:methylmalonyl-CoA/ethylmalonyl-CoA epimerase
MKEGKMVSINHIAIAVRNLEDAERLYESALGLKVTHREVVEEQGVRTSILETVAGDTAIELLEPIGENSPIFKFLEKKGEGIHHICFKVDDIESALQRLKNQGIKLINDAPKPGVHGTKVAFLHPKALNGVLIELAELPKD